MLNGARVACTRACRRGRTRLLLCPAARDDAEAERSRANQEAATGD
ncbi:MAG: hypothetical protein AAGF95_01650 [Chloroflexota bacterium]